MVDEALGSSRHDQLLRSTNSPNQRVDEALGTSHYSQEERNITNSSNQMVDEALGEQALSNISGLQTNSSNQMVDEALGVHIPDQVVGQLVRVLDTPLPLQPVAVSESEQVSAASSSRVVSTLPIDEVLTLKAIGTSVEYQVEENLGTQRREAIMIESIRVPQRPSAKTNGEYQLPRQNCNSRNSCDDSLVRQPDTISSHHS